jgi:hypothetical protein
MEGERSQAFTLEAVIASLLLVSSLVVALQMSAVTPLSASTSSQYIETQLEDSADGVLAASIADGSLRRALLYYDENATEFVNAGYNGYYASNPPNITFGQRLDWAFDQRGIAYNVYIQYQAEDVSRTQRLIYRGKPSDNAVAATTALTLVDDDPLYNNPDGDDQANPRTLNISATDDFYLPDQSSTGLYSTVHVKVVVWRI